MTATARDLDVVAGAVLRVRAAGEVVGAAFLVAPDLAATAATVVAEALGVEPRDRPGATVQLDFPLLRDEHDEPERVSARVERRQGEVVLLRLTGTLPPARRMAPLRRVEELAGREFSALGFPEGLTDGVWATGRIDADGPRHRLHSAVGDQPVDAGFAGAPVWETRTGAVAGMAVHPDGAHLVPIDEVLGLDPERLPCPYLGLRAFAEADADTFFGRDDDIERLADLVERRPVVAVAGPSGAGKSSLVRAGLAPRLRAAGADVVHLRAEPGAVLPEPGDRDVLVIDQFEELAALDPAAARELLEEVVRRTDPRAQRTVRAVLTLRWTTLDEMLTPELIDALDAGTVLVGPLDRERLREAIVRPAERPPGLAFEPGLVETILDDAGAEPGRLPLVESLLADLWERRDGGVLTLRDYAAAGGVTGAVARHADAVADGLPAGAEDALRRLLTALARPDREGRFTRRPVPLDQLPAAQRELVPALSAGRLLTVAPSARGDVVELAHQALVQHWPRLRDWLVADREFLAWREQVGLQRERWEAETRADAALLRGATLARASDWLPARADELAPTDLDYLRRSSARQRREVRRWRIVTAVVAVLALGAAGLGVVAVRSGDQIATRLAAANADTLGRDAQARHPDDPTTAAQLALAAWRADPDNPQARTALAQSSLAMRPVERELPALTRAPIGDVFVGGDTALLVAAPHPTLVTGLSGPDPQHRELTGVRSDRQVALSPDGRWMAVQTGDRSRVELHDLVGDLPPVPLPAVPGAEVGVPRFSPDGTRLTWLGVEGPEQLALHVWDLQSGSEVRHGVGPLPADTRSATLVPGNDRVVVRHGDVNLPESRLVLRELADGAEIATLPEGARTVLDGAAVATCEPGAEFGAPGAVVVTPFDGSPPRRFAHTGSCSGLSAPMLSASGHAMLERHTGRTWRVTDLRTGGSHHVTVPAEPPSVSLPTFSVTQTLTVPGSGGSGAVLALGTSLLWLRAEPLPPGDGLAAGERIVGLDERFHVVRARDGYFTAENGTGARLGEVTGVHTPDSQAFTEQDRLWHAGPVPGGWQVTGYDLPQLRPVTEILLPSRDGGTPPGDRGAPPRLSLLRDPAAPDRLVALADGVLSSWDTETGRALGPQIPLGDSEREVGLHRTYPRVAARPGHPGQVAVLGTGSVQIWDVTAGRLVVDVPARASLDGLDGPSPFTFDPAGEHLIVLGRDRTVQRWDLATAQPVGAPFPAPTTVGLLGIDLDGYLVTVVDSGAGLAFVDLDTGVAAGSVDAEDMTRSLQIRDLGDDRRTVRLTDLTNGWRFDMPVTAQAWHDHLCAAVARPFTEAERRLLPPGTDPDPPCS